jgi:hypothetical protein
VQPACKPVSVPFHALQEILERFPSFILALYRYNAHTTYPPASDEQSLAPVYMVFQPIRRTARDVATPAGELLPHLFTLIRQPADGYFLLRCYTLADIFPLGNMALCVARTFLPDKSGRWNSLLPCKVKNLTLIWIQAFYLCLFLPP